MTDDPRPWPSRRDRRRGERTRTVIRPGRGFQPEDDMTDAELRDAIRHTDPVLLGLHVEFLYRHGETEMAKRLQRARHDVGALAHDFTPEAA